LFEVYVPKLIESGNKKISKYERKLRNIAFEPFSPRSDISKGVLDVDENFR